jgi:hypothetical protein
MQIEEKARIATEVFNVCVSNSDTFEADDNLGANVAYLMGAVLNGQRFEANKSHRAFMRLLREHFEPSHAVWSAIDYAE